jgi:hypothetical protein
MVSVVHSRYPSILECYTDSYVPSFFHDEVENDEMIAHAMQHEFDQEAEVTSVEYLPRMLHTGKYTNFSN